MSIHDIRKNYYHITKSQLQHHKQIDSLELQTAVEAFKAKGGKIEVIPMGMSHYLTDLQKTRLKKEERKRKYQ